MKITDARRREMTAQECAGLQRIRRGLPALWVTVALVVWAHGSSVGAVEANETGRLSKPGDAASTDRLIPLGLPELEWTAFEAAGFSQPVAGMIYRPAHPTCCGVALGGLGTGCLDIETSGVLGFSTIFNHPNWPRGRSPQLQLPFLGLSVGDTVWVLAAQKFIEGGTFYGCTDPMSPFVPTPPERLAAWQSKVPPIEGVRGANDIRYWGHFPVADIEYETDAPVSVGLRAWSPFIPGDMIASNTPGAVFEVHVRNNSDTARSGTLAFSFPGPNSPTEHYGKLAEAEGLKAFSERYPLLTDYGRFKWSEVSEGELRGVTLTSVDVQSVEYFLGVIGNEKVRTGKGLASDPTAWSRIASRLPNPNSVRETVESISDETSEFPPIPGVSVDSSASVAVDFQLQPGETKAVRFLLAWYSPGWAGLNYAYLGGADTGSAKPHPRWSPDPEASDSKREHYVAMYATRYANAVEVARRLAKEHESLLTRVLAWQEAIYTDKKLPVWLRDCLVNNLNLIAEDSYWAQPEPPLEWAAPLGAFGMDESPRGCSVMGCIVSNWYGDLPLTYFFPELERMILRDYTQYMRPDGAIVFMFPAGDFTIPCFQWLGPLNGACFAELVHRLWFRTGDDTILQEFYPAVKRNLIFTMNMKPGPAGIISAPWEGPGQEWWEHTPVQGMVSHLGGMRLAQIGITEAIAKKMGDAEFAEQCRSWFRQGSDLLEDNLWSGDYYVFFRDPERGKESDLIMSPQLDGDWSMFLNGFGSGVFPRERAEKALDTIWRTCLVDCGLVGFSDPKSSALLVEYGTFPPEINIVGMTYLYHGEHERGLEIVRRNMDNMVRKQRHPWDLPNLIRCDTGERTYGTDYFQNMVLWAMPAAIAGEDLTGPCKEGGLVDRVLLAASGP